MGAVLPFGKFFWSDYAVDPALKVCSFAAQGLWMRMLCIAAEHDPVGYVAVNSRGLDDVAIARATGGARDEVAELLAELEQNGVFSRDRRGWIYSRRMVRDAKRHREASEWGTEGAARRYGKPYGKTSTPKAKPKGEVKPDPCSRDQSPESKGSVGKPTAAERGADDDDFDPVKALFDDGIEVLGKTGVKANRARSLIGAWRKAHGDEAVAIAIAAAESRGISQPLEWIPKHLAARAERQPKSTSATPFLDHLTKELEHEGNAGGADRVTQQ